MPFEASEGIVHIQKGVATPIRLTVFPGVAGTFTIGIVDAAGAEVVASGTAVVDNGDDTYDFTVLPQPDVGLLTATWTETGGGGSAFTTVIDVVGGFLFTEDQARSYVTDRLSSPLKYSDEAIRSERRRITDWLEKETAVSWIPRFRRVELDGTGGSKVTVFHPVRSVGGSGGQGAASDIQKVLSVTVDGSPVSPAEVKAVGASLHRTAGVWPRPATTPGNVVVEYEYGRPHLLDGVDRVALLELRHRLVDSRVPAGATSMSDELGSVSWEAQNNGRPSRIPEVNAWLRSHDERVPIAG